MFRISALALTALMALTLATARADDLESQIDQAKSKIAGTDPAKLPDTDRALRLLAAYTRLSKAPVALGVQTPPDVDAPQIAVMSAGKLKGPFNYDDAVAELKQCQKNLDDAKNPDVKTTWKKYVDQWSKIIKQIEAELDLRVKARGKEEAFDLESINSFADLAKFVRDSKVIQDADPAVIQNFTASTQGLSDTTGLDEKLAKKLANVDGKWWLAGPSFGLGEMAVTLNGDHFDATTPFNNSTFTVDRDQVKGAKQWIGTGKWTATARDGKPYGGEMTLEISQDGKLINLKLWLEKRDDDKNKNAWAEWHANKIEKK